MNIAICDDEHSACIALSDKIKAYCGALNIPVTIGIFRSAIALLKESLADYDVIFLDVMMPQVDGIEAGQVISKKSTDTILVYVSSLIDHAPDSLEVGNTIRYLLKERLDEKLGECMTAVLRKLNFQSQKITIDFIEGEMSIFRHEILYVDSLGHLLTLYFSTAKREPLKTRKHTLKDMLTILGEDLFVRIDHSHLVNMSFIDEITNDLQGNKCVFDDGKSLYISQRRFQDVKRQYFLFKGTQ